MISYIILDKKLSYLEQALKKFLPEFYTLSLKSLSNAELYILTKANSNLSLEKQIIVESPIHIEQLVQKINNKLYNIKYVYKNVILYPIKKQIIFKGKSIHITEMESKLLAYFFKNKLDKAPKNHLLEKVWSYSHDNISNTLETHSKNLRTKFSILGIENAIFIEDGKCTLNL